MLLRNVNPLGQVDLPLLAREGEPLGQEGEGCLEPREVFDCRDDLAAALLEQLGNFEPAEGAEPADEQAQPRLRKGAGS